MQTAVSTTLMQIFCQKSEMFSSKSENSYKILIFVHKIFFLKKYS